MDIEVLWRHGAVNLLVVDIRCTEPHWTGMTGSTPLARCRLFLDDLYVHLFVRGFLRPWCMLVPSEVIPLAWLRLLLELFPPVLAVSIRAPVEHK